METFTYQPSIFVPFRDKNVLDRVRNIKREDIEKHSNPDFRICIMPDPEVEFMFLMDMFYRIKKASDEGTKLVMIIPQPYTAYSRIAYLINKFKVNCEKLYTFNMDEYCNEDGVIAPETWPQGFTYSLKQNFYSKIDKNLRPPENQMIGFTNDNIKDYGQMLADLGGADICYSGPGWTGHLAFIEPDAPEFSGSLEEWKRMGPRIVTLSPYTLAQNSLHGSFGMSGDLSSVPPKAATIGPAEVIASKHRIDMHALTIRGTNTTWQRMISRLVLHGPVTPLVPESILQTLRTHVWVSESLAQNIEPNWNEGY
jgi:glucosamine-6-phosphate deaminase